MIKIQMEDFKEIKSDLDIINPHYYEELCSFKEKMKWAWHEPTYEAAYNAGNLGTITIRDDDKIVGYMTFFVVMHPHYIDIKVALIDLIYLLKEYRKGFNGVNLLKEFERICKDVGIDVIMGGDKKAYDLGRLFEFLDWKPLETQYSKWIGDK